MPNYIMDMSVLLCAEKLHIYAASGLYPDAFLIQKVGEIALWMEWLVLQMTKSPDVQFNVYIPRDVFGLS
jgi:hypothetical protein